MRHLITHPDDMKNKKPNKTAKTAARIIEAVAKYYQVSAADLITGGRPEPLATARQVAMFILTGIDGLQLEKIGQIFNGRHYTTVIFAREKIRAAINQGGPIADAIETLTPA